MKESRGTFLIRVAASFYIYHITPTLLYTFLYPSFIPLWFIRRASLEIQYNFRNPRDFNIGR